jgi:hypothetical protein
MPVEATCACCGGRQLLPDPPPRTMDERFDFERAWDKRWREGIKPKVVHENWPEPETQR